MYSSMYRQCYKCAISFPDLKALKHHQLIMHCLPCLQCLNIFELENKLESHVCPESSHPNESESNPRVESESKFDLWIPLAIPDDSSTDTDPELEENEQRRNYKESFDRPFQQVHTTKKDCDQQKNKNHLQRVVASAPTLSKVRSTIKKDFDVCHESSHPNENESNPRVESESRFDPRIPSANRATPDDSSTDTDPELEENERRRNYNESFDRLFQQVHITKKDCDQQKNKNHLNGLPHIRVVPSVNTLLKVRSTIKKNFDQRLKERRMKDLARLAFTSSFNESLSTECKSLHKINLTI
ncbi:hypothetical protein TKK_0010779 [Trichogramma kaykai]|uniref:C2H2-type domain-containing protein n=1 Tax=Trichogramma kaykai TaxID=54128 RepID=A0ABD2WW48_9HYME